MFNLCFSTMAGNAEIKRKYLSRRYFNKIYEKSENRNRQQSKESHFQYKDMKDTSINKDIFSEDNESQELLTSDSEEDENSKFKEDGVDEILKGSLREEIRERDIRYSQILARSSLGQDDLENKHMNLKLKKNSQKISMENRNGASRNFSIYQNLQRAYTSKISQKRLTQSKLLSKTNLLSVSEIQQRSIRSPSEDQMATLIQNEDMQLNEEACQQNKQMLIDMQKYNEEFFYDKEELQLYTTIPQYQNFIKHTYRKFVESFEKQYNDLYQKVTAQEEFLRFRDLKKTRDILYNRNDILVKQERILNMYLDNLKKESSNTTQLLQQSSASNKQNKEKYKLNSVLIQKEEECKKLEEELQVIQLLTNSNKQKIKFIFQTETQKVESTMKTRLNQR